MKKDRAATEEKIYDSFLNLLEKQGPQAVGINAIAKEAGVSKSLIYRYYGGMKGLLLQLAKRGDFFRTMMLSDEGEDKLAELKFFAKAGTNELRENQLTQEILRWQLIENNEYTRDLFKFVNKELGNKFAFSAENESLNHALQLMIGGYIYFALLSKFNKSFLHTNLRSEETWSNFDEAIEKTIDLFDED